MQPVMGLSARPPQGLYSAQGLYFRGLPCGAVGLQVSVAVGFRRRTVCQKVPLGIPCVGNKRITRSDLM